MLCTLGREADAELEDGGDGGDGGEGGEQDVPYTPGTCDIAFCDAPLLEGASTPPSFSACSITTVCD